jgi:hypothetical protein
VRHSRQDPYSVMLQFGKDSIDLCPDPKISSTNEGFIHIRLIPKSKLDDRDTITTQLQNVQVSTVARVVQKHTFSYGGCPYSGLEDEGGVSLSAQDNHLQIIMTKDDISASSPPLELINGIIRHCGVVDPVHRNLAQFILSEENHKRLKDACLREGIHVPDTTGGIA